MPYEALSYAWNKELPTERIYLHRRFRLVTHDLYCALLQLRLPDKVRTIWVDVLCIAQYDVREKSHQIQLIWRIYQSADRVWAWLGEDGSDVKKALKFCDFLRDLLLNEVSELKEHCKLYQGHWLACEALFFRRPWWRRQWTITEVCHDKPVQVCIGLHQFTIEEPYAKFEVYVLWLKALDEGETNHFLASGSNKLDFTIIMTHRVEFKTQQILEASSCTLLRNLHWFRGRGSRLLLVLRRQNDKAKCFLLDACVLINSTLSSFSPGEIVTMGSLETSLDVTNDKSRQVSGFSPVMYSALCCAASDGRCSIKEFLIE